MTGSDSALRGVTRGCMDLDAVISGRRLEHSLFTDLPPTVAWIGGEDGFLQLLDQTRLPETVAVRRCDDARSVFDAIRELCVRGAPAIGVAGAYGVCVSARPLRSSPEFLRGTRESAEFLKSSRPTAVNLAWAIDRVLAVAEAHRSEPPASIWSAMLAECHAISLEESRACRAIGEAGARLIRDGAGVLTHCNAGALATTAYGTALAPMYVARERGVHFQVYADETRPLLQGARLTAFELAAAGIDVTVLCDGAAAAAMASGRINLVIVGADRIAGNGDTANKIGTYAVALAARGHGIPFYVAAPPSTFDRSLADGRGIPIEERAPGEVSEGFGRRTVARDVRCWNPAFDVTPADLITGIIVPGRVLEPVTAEKIADFFG